jgi:hypothetical protein
MFRMTITLCLREEGTYWTRQAAMTLNPRHPVATDSIINTKPPWQSEIIQQIQRAVALSTVRANQFQRAGAKHYRLAMRV